MVNQIIHQYVLLSAWLYDGPFLPLTVVSLAYK